MKHFSADLESLPAFELIDRQLAEARAELAALEQAVDELPQILEAKFRQGVAAVVETNRHLYIQQLALQRQSAAALPPARVGWTVRWSALQSRFPRLDPLWSRRLALAPLIAAGLSGCVWLAMQSMQWGQRPLSRPVPPSPAAQTPASASGTTLVLRARGTSWVEVQDLATREVIYMGLLEAGQERTIRIGTGLRLRSGRPDLLMLQMDAGQLVPFSEANDLGWRTVLPPALKKAGA